MRPSLLLLTAALVSACAATPDPPASRDDSISVEVVLADPTADPTAEWEAFSEARRAPYREMLAGGPQGPDRPPFPVGGMAGLMANVTYPTEAIRNGYEGTVVVEATVAADGTVTAVGDVRHEALAPSAVAAVRRTAFAPAERDGVPVAAVVRVPLVLRFR